MAYATRQEVRGLDALSDINLFTDTLVDEAIIFAESVVDGYCGTSFEVKEFTVERAGHDRSYLFLPILFVRSITEVTVDGVAVPGDWHWSVERGSIWCGSYGYAERNLFAGNVVSVTGTAGITTEPPPDIAWATRHLSRQYLLDLVSRVPDRALSVQSDYGTIALAQAGGQNRPTSLPEVNAVLNRHRHTGPVVG